MFLYIIDSGLRRNDRGSQIVIVSELAAAARFKLDTFFQEPASS